MEAAVIDDYIRSGVDIVMIQSCLEISPSLSMGYTIQQFRLITSMQVEKEKERLAR